MSARRRSKSKRKVLSSADKWKGKVWVEIKSPLYIGEKTIGFTPANEPENAIGRHIRVSQPTITSNFKDLHKIITFKIVKVNGTTAVTEFDGYELSRDYMRSSVRNHRSRIDGIFNLKFSDDARVRMTVFCVTPVRAKSSERREIRRIMTETVLEAVEGLTFPAFVNQVLDGTITSKVYAAIADYFPVKVLEISKIKVLRLAQN